jgi:hypothetical protein
VISKCVQNFASQIIQLVPLHHGKKQQKALGLSMRVERSTVDQVKARFDAHKRKKEEDATTGALDFNKRVVGLALFSPRYFAQSEHQLMTAGGPCNQSAVHVTNLSM